MSGMPATWDRLTSVGSLALRIEEHDVDGGAARPTVAGLRVTDLTSGKIAVYRPGSALYGFVGLPPGPRRLLIEDPSDRYVPRVLVASVAEPARLVTTAVRLGPGGAVPRGQLVLWGDVVRASGAVAAYALVRIRHSAGATWTTTTDATGRYLVWARGLPPRDVEDGAWTLSLTVRGRGATAADPTEALPDDLDALDDAALAAWYDQALPPQAVTAPQGARTRISTLSLP